jgi:F420-0:gamma-glutamyl ligase
MTEELIQKYESLYKEIADEQEKLDYLENNRIQNENRLAELIALAKSAQDIGEVLTYPLIQIRELDVLLMDSIDEIKEVVDKLDVLNMDHEKLGLQLVNAGLEYKNVGNAFEPLYKWVNEK